MVKINGVCGECLERGVGKGKGKGSDEDREEGEGRLEYSVKGRLWEEEEEG